MMFAGFVGSADAPTNDVWDYGPPHADGTCSVDGDCVHHRALRGRRVLRGGELRRVRECNDPASVGTCAPWPTARRAAAGRAARRVRASAAPAAGGSSGGGCALVETDDSARGSAASRSSSWGSPSAVCATRDAAADPGRFPRDAAQRLRTGDGVSNTSSRAVPRPSWPASFAPTHDTTPLESTHVCPAPAATASAVPAEGTVVGRAQGLRGRRREHVPLRVEPPARDEVARAEHAARVGPAGDDAGERQRAARGSIGCGPNCGG